MGVLIARWRAVKSNNHMVEVDPLIESLYRWSDISGVLLMGIIGGTMARKRGYDIIGFSLSRCFLPWAAAWCATSLLTAAPWRP